MGSDQSHWVTTTLRSRPCGRDGLKAGNSPAAIRSVQSANNSRERERPIRLMFLTIYLIAWPDSIRRCHASTEESKSPNSLGISRVALLPSW